MRWLADDAELAPHGQDDLAGEVDALVSRADDPAAAFLAVTASYLVVG